MCELCDDDRVTVVIADGSAPSITDLVGECGSIIGDLERRLDRERDHYARRQLVDTMWGIRWARECLLCSADSTRQWQEQPTTGELLVRYPHPDEQQP